MSESKSSLDMEYQELLKDLKSTVEGLLISQVANVWNVYGGLNRLHSAMDRIFKHRFKMILTNGDPDLISFIYGLNWLHPNIENSTSVITDSEYQPHLPSHLKNNKAAIWLYRSIESHSLSQKLSWLLSDKNHILQCYEENAFLCQEKYAEATLICLRAVERYQPNLLSEINPCLFFIKSEFISANKTHRRSSSFPYFGINHKWNVHKEEINISVTSNSISVLEKSSKEITSENFISSSMCNIKSSENLNCDLSIVPKCNELNKDQKIRKHLGKLKPWNSLTNITIDDSLSPKRERSATMSQFFTQPNTPSHSIGSPTLHKLSPSCLEVDYVKLQADTSHDFIKNSLLMPSSSINQNVSNDLTSTPNTIKQSVLLSKRISRNSIDRTDCQTPDIIENKKKESEAISIQSMPIKRQTKFVFFSGTSPEYNFMSMAALAGERDTKRCPKKSFIETDGSSIAPMATGYFPKPIEGQSLISFLSSGHFSKTRAELDRENAHFNISEALISAIEQLKFNKRMKTEEEQDDSDDEINNLRQRIRMRRKQKQEERRKVFDGELRSHCTELDVTSNENVTSLSTSPESIDNSESTEGGVDDLDVDSASYLADSRSISVSLASLYSETDVLRKPREAPDGQSDVVTSAESVALSLISKFNKKHLPKASELEWLVSEHDAPQALLPLPSSWPVSPDAEDTYSSSPNHNTTLRGTFDWAPPRPQIIFTVHPPPVRSILLAKQNYRCAGCGMRVATQYASRFRYCDYLGRYFCTGCHTNQLSLIPGRILSKWIFKRYPVSNFSYRLLDQMNTDPLFNITDINPYLCRKSKELNKCQQLRLQLFYMKDFIISCRFAQKIEETLKKEQNHLFNEVDIYSINDLIMVKKGELQLKLSQLKELCSYHVDECELCQARGFICEICSHKDVIFPWQINQVSRCSICAACYHKSCWIPGQASPCCKCLRLKQRRESMVAI